MKMRIANEANPIGTEIDAQDTLEIVRTIQEQDTTVAAAVKQEIANIAQAVDVAAKALRRGGRLFYVGAGTSGRIAVLDAAECPPTFGTPPEMVQAVIAGGARALTRAAEAAEDDAAQGRHDLAARKLSARDVVVGISASGYTPYTVGALRYARSRRAITVGITSSTGSPLARIARIAIVPITGREVVAGSTRMKAAIAQMMVLHTISTGAMILLGNVYRNYMVGVRPTNKKLWERACSILESVTGADRPTAEATLCKAGKDVKLAIVMLHCGLDRRSAKNLLASMRGNLRKLIK